MTLPEKRCLYETHSAGVCLQDLLRLESTRRSIKRRSKKLCTRPPRSGSTGLRIDLRPTRPNYHYHHYYYVS